MENCIDCRHHEVISDPDPHDSFCSDDVAVVCKLTPNDQIKQNTLYHADASEWRKVTVSCRPYNTRKESETPKWCPLITKGFLRAPLNKKQQSNEKL